MKISLIHPSRGRPKMAAVAYAHWLENWSGKHPIEYILSVDSDKESEQYLNYFKNALTNPNRSIVDAVNNAAQVSSGDILVVISDDFKCPKNWDEKIIEVAAGKRDWIMKTCDLSDNLRVRQPWIITLPIMDRNYYERFGYIYYPEYRHMFADTEQTHVATLLNKVIDAQHLLFPHNHWQTGINPRDKINERADSTWAQGEELYLRRMKEKFGLKEEEIKGGLTMDKCADHINWLMQKRAI